MIKDLPSNARDIGLITGQGTKTPHDTGQLSPHTPTTEPLGSEPAHHKIASTAKVKKKKCLVITGILTTEIVVWVLLFKDSELQVVQ